LLMASSLQKQVLYRLLAAFIASGLVVIASTLWFQSRALEGRVLLRQQDITDHFQGRIADLHREWEEHAAQLKQSLEFTRILESRRLDLLKAFFLTQSSNADFTYAIIADSRGALLLQYGADDEARKALGRIKKQDSWFYYRAQKTLYHVFTVPVWLGNTETGFLFLLKPLDNALLGQIAYPRTDLYLVLDGQPVASSLGGKGVEQFSGVDGKAIVKGTRYAQASMPWKIPHERSTAAPTLVIRTQIRDSLSGFDIVMIVLASLAVLALASWLLLGAWIHGIIRNIVDLKTSTDLFARERKPLATEVLPGPGKRGEQADELGALTTGLASMMAAVTESEQRYREGEEVLRKEHDFSASLVDTAPVIILLLDTQGMVQYVNPYFEQLSGYRMDEIKGREWSGTFLPERDRARIRALFRTAMHDAPVRANINPIVTKSGEEREIEWNARAMRDGQGQVTAMLSIGLDVTERKQAEEKYRNILQTAIDGFWTVDLQGRLLEVNEAYCRMSGYSREELLRMSIPDLEITEKPEETRGHIETIIAQGSDRFITKHRRKNGSIMDVEVSVQHSSELGDLMVVFLQDITERRRVEQDLKIKNYAIETSINGIAISDMRGIITYVNKAYVAMLGFDRADEILGRTLTDFSESDQAAHAVREALRNNGGWIGEIAGRKKDGALVPRLMSASMVTDADGTPISVLGSFLDITEQKATLKKLEESERKFRTIFDQAHDGILVADTETSRFFMANAKACAMLGYTAGELHVLEVKDIHPDAAFPRVIASFQDILAGKTAMTEDVPVLRKDGRVFYADISASPVEFQGRLYAIGIFRDITERKRTEAKLRELDRRQKAILNNIPDMAWLKDSKGRFLAVNEPFGKACGSSPDALVGKTDLDIWPAELAEQYRSDDRAVMESGARKQVEEPLIDSTGRRQWIETIKTPIMDDQGRIIGTTGIARDVTERKRAEEKILAALAEKELLLKEIHHRVKNNLQIIASLLYLQAEEVKDPKTGGLLKESRDRIKSMALVHEKLYSTNNLSRIDFMEYCGSLGAYLFNAYGAAVRGIRLEARGSGIFLEVDTAIPCGLVLSELLSNALKYAFPGGRKGVVHITASLDASGDLDLIIGDDGIGLPPGLALESANTLGLRLVHKLTGQLHGRITADSGNGAVFHLSIPLHGRKGKERNNG